MKKVFYIVIPIVVLMLGVGIYLGVSIINSPEYALMQIANDIEEFGVDGLMPHLTDEVQETVSRIASITENKMINSIFSFLGKDDYGSVLKSNLKDVEWIVEDVLKGKEKADVVLGFNYNDKLIGTVEIKMMRENSDWKISGMDIPKFIEINL